MRRYVLLLLLSFVTPVAAQSYRSNRSRGLVVKK
jgi:hypothetical protein